MCITNPASPKKIILGQDASFQHQPEENPYFHTNFTFP
jgi:hypothetical protein